MKWALFKTKNGWIVHTDSYFSTSDAEKFHVFTNIRDLTSYLIRESGEKKRDESGRFLKVVAK